jgi:hypothetical protein
MPRSYLNNSVADALEYFDEVGVKEFNLKKSRGQYTATATLKNGEVVEVKGRDPDKVANALLEG